MPTLLKRLLLAVVALVLLSGIGAVAWGEGALRRARAALDRHHPRRAQELLAQCSWPAKGGSEWHLLAGRAARMLDDADGAEQHLTECQRREGQPSDESTLEWAMLRGQRGEVDAVEEFLRKKVDTNDPHATMVLEAMGLGYLRVYRLFDAMNCARQWLERTPEQPRALVFRGRVHHRAHAFGKAIDDFRAALDRDSNDDTRLLLANSLIENSQAPDAVPILEDLRTRRPDDADVLVKLAFAWNMAGRSDDCRKLLDEILAKHPNLGPALSARGQLELQLHHPAEAERWLREALKRTPYDRQTHYALSQALHQQPGREKEAEAQEKRLQKIEATIARMIEVTNRLLPLKPTDPKLNYELATLLMEMGYEAQAEPWFHKALQYDPHMTAAHQALADYYGKHGEHDRAAHHRAQFKESPK